MLIQEMTQLEPFPLHRSRCTKTCVLTNTSSQINTPGGLKRHDSGSRARLATLFTLLPVLHRGRHGETGCGGSGQVLWTSAFRNKEADLSVAKHFCSSRHSAKDMMVSLIRTRLRNTLERRRAEGRLIFAYWTLQPSGMNVDFNFVWTLAARAVSDFWISLRAFCPTAISPMKGQQFRKVWPSQNISANADAMAFSAFGMKR